MRLMPKNTVPSAEEQKISFAKRPFFASIVGGAFARSILGARVPKAAPSLTIRSDSFFSEPSRLSSRASLAACVSNAISRICPHRKYNASRIMQRSLNFRFLSIFVRFFYFRDFFVDFLIFCSDRVQMEVKKVLILLLIAVLQSQLYLALPSKTNRNWPKNLIPWRKF